jgi:hypothetical protein
MASGQQLVAPQDPRMTQLPTPPGVWAQYQQRDQRFLTARLRADNILAFNRDAEDSNPGSSLGGEQDHVTPAPSRAAPGVIVTGVVQTPGEMRVISQQTSIKASVDLFNAFLTSHASAYAQLLVAAPIELVQQWINELRDAADPLNTVFLQMDDPGREEARQLISAHAAYHARTTKMYSSFKPAPQLPPAQVPQPPPTEQQADSVQITNGLGAASRMRGAQSVTTRVMSTMADGKPYVLYGCHAAPTDLPAYMHQIYRPRVRTVDSVLRKQCKSAGPLTAAGRPPKNDTFIKWMLSSVNCPNSRLPDLLKAAVALHTDDPTPKQYEVYESILQTWYAVPVGVYSHNIALLPFRQQHERSTTSNAWNVPS